jgi:hypothetical protein
MPVHFKRRVDRADPRLPASFQAEAARLEGLGAKRLSERRLGPRRRIVTGDPEGGEFGVHS